MWIYTQTLIHASKEDDLEVNTEKTKYMLLSRHQNAGNNHDIKIGNRCFENFAQFRYLGTTITNQNLVQEETELGQCLLPFGPEPFVLASAVYKHKN
jgi:hypothetical protein